MRRKKSLILAMPPDWFLKIIVPDRLIYNNNIWISPDSEAEKKPWSFAEEWKEHRDTQQQRTWDMTAAERLKHFYSVTHTQPGQLPGMVVLDAGCGN
jgi:hypothetical protein